VLRYLRQRNIPAGELISAAKDYEKKEGRPVNIDLGGSVFHFGAVSDTHLGAKSCNYDELEAMYDVFEKRGIKAVTHSGDLCDGNGYVYKGQLSELDTHGIDDTVEMICKRYPKRKGIKTYFIAGNHDESFLLRENANIGKMIEAKRPDMQYLGFYDADVSINGVRVRLCHGGGGGSYALSYRLQKRVENLTGENKPQILIEGHYHTAIYACIRNIHCLTGGTFQGANNFSKRFGMPNVRGGWIIGVGKTRSNEIRTFVPEFTNFA
jgi:predicted phosphodiesterase